MSDLIAITEALAANLSGISGLHESAYMLSNPTPPAAEIEIGPIDYDSTFGRGMDTVTLIVRVFVGFTSDIGASKRLRTMMSGSGSSSIKAAIESDRQLGGLVQDLRATKMSGEKWFLREVTGTAGRGSSQGPLLGAEWTVTVLTDPE